MPFSEMQPVVWMFSPEYESNTGSGKYILMPPSACTTLMKLSKLSSTKCWMGIPKSSSMALMS